MLPWEYETTKIEEDCEPKIEKNPIGLDRPDPCDCKSCTFDKRGPLRRAFASLQHHDHLELEPDQLMLCAPYVYGYVLAAKKWGTTFFPKHIVSNAKMI